MRHIFTLAAVLTLALTTGCTTFYPEASSNEPHAVLKFEASDGLGKVLGGQKVVPLQINGLPPNDWTKLTLRSFNLVPGPTRLFLLVHGTQRVQATVFLRFEAVAGKTYQVLSSDKEEYYLVEIKDEIGAVVVSRRADKEVARNGGGAYIPIFIPMK